MPNDESPIDPANHTPGWYPDPLEGHDGLRWWDGKQWTAHAQPKPQQPQWSAAGPPPPPAQQKNGWVKWAALGLVGAVVIIGLASAFGDSSGEDDKKSAAPSTSQWTYTPPPPDPSAIRRSQENEAAQAEASKQRQIAADQERQRQLDPSQYETITERDWLLIARDPDAAAGRKVHLYGHVTQFDAGTGDKLRASVGAEQVDWYDFDTNSLVQAGIDGALDNVVKGDLVSIYARIDGSTTYSTTMGGETTVPLLNAYIVEVTGSV